MSANSLVPFVFEESSIVRAIEIDGAPFFVASDVARALSYRNPQDAVRRHCKGVRETRTPSEGGEQLTAVIPEGDVYRLVIRSKLETAARFETWLMDELLPTLRRSGTYTLKAAALDRLATARSSHCVSDAAKVLQVAPRELFSFLNKRGWIFRRPGSAAWIGYQAKVIEGVIEHKVWEQEGADGNPRLREQVRVTSKGLTILAQMLHNARRLGGEPGDLSQPPMKVVSHA